MMGTDISYNIECPEPGLKQSVFNPIPAGDYSSKFVINAVKKSKHLSETHYFRKHPKGETLVHVPIFVLKMHNECLSASGTFTVHLMKPC